MLKTVNIKQFQLVIMVGHAHAIKVDNINGEIILSFKLSHFNTNKPKPGAEDVELFKSVWRCVCKGATAKRIQPFLKEWDEVSVQGKLQQNHGHVQIVVIHLDHSAPLNFEVDVND